MAWAGRGCTTPPPVVGRLNFLQACRAEGSGGGGGGGEGRWGGGWAGGGVVAFGGLATWGAAMARPQFTGP